MAHRTSVSDWSGPGRLVRTGSRPARERRAASDDDHCTQCNFPWGLHPERYDAEEESMVRVCSEYPAEPIRSIEACLVP